MNNASYETSLFKTVFLTVFAAAVIVFCMAEASLASAISSAGNNIGQKLCDAAASVYGTGTIGKGVATLGVVTVGIAACFGRASWTQAIVVAVGIAVIFGANTLAQGFGIGC